MEPLTLTDPFQCALTEALLKSLKIEALPFKKNPYRTLVVALSRLRRTKEKIAETTIGYSAVSVVSGLRVSGLMDGGGGRVQITSNMAGSGSGFRVPYQGSSPTI